VTGDLIRPCKKVRVSCEFIEELRCNIGEFYGSSFGLHTLTFVIVHLSAGTTVAQWLKCCATNRKVAGSIPAGVNGFFIDIKSFRSHYGPGVDSASNRNEYQEYFLGVRAAGA